ncbi:MAG: hypothetical protein ACXWW5_00420 [Actinomycetota bacterium]
MNAAVRRSPTGRLVAELNATLVHEAGWELTASFRDAARERWFLRDRCALADITPRAKVDVRGDLDPWLAAAPGHLARIASGWALVVGGPGEETSLVPALEALTGTRTMVTDVTHLFAGFALAGPSLDAVLARTSSWDPVSLAPGSATGAPVGGVPAVVVRGRLEVPLLEIYVAAEFGRFVWETLLGVVTSAGGGPVGWNALRDEGWS